MEILIFLALFATGYFFGSRNEKKHYDSIFQREKELLYLPITNTKKFSTERKIKKSEMLTGSAVISIDYFKKVLSGLRNIFGGNIACYETLIDRARREAILRLREQAKDANIIVNLRIETSDIGGNESSQKNSIASIEALAYGTAIWYE